VQRFDAGFAKDFRRPLPVGLISYGTAKTLLRHGLDISRCAPLTIITLAIGTLWLWL
jgi:hypothetical protein